MSSRYPSRERGILVRAAWSSLNEVTVAAKSFLVIARRMDYLGSARVPRVGFGVSPKQAFSCPQFEKIARP
jgi:hypothetical protein